MNLILCLDSQAVQDCIETQIHNKAKYVNFKVNIILEQSDLWSQINVNNDELNSKNNFEIIIYYIIRLNASIVAIVID